MKKEYKKPTARIIGTQLESMYATSPIYKKSQQLTVGSTNEGEEFDGEFDSKKRGGFYEGWDD